MMRYPDISARHLVFTYADDLWLAPREGGLAVPLATPTGRETFGRFSPDGKTVAFVANYDGGVDLYTLPAVGGIPRRVTHHPSGEILCDWTPDGDKLLFSANGYSATPVLPEFFLVDADGGFPERLPIAYGEGGALSPDGKWLAYTPFNVDFRTWKRYRGGLASDIWLFNLETKESKRVTEWEGGDTAPMWQGETLYYLSDAGPAHRMNIWSLDPESGDREQITKFEEFDVKFPAIGPGPEGDGEIIFQLGAALRVLDLKTKETRTVEVRIPGARPTLRPKVVDASNYIAGATISPAAKRVALEARGDIWSVPASEGAPRNLTATDGAAERDPAWSPDGRWIAYFSDAAGDYDLYLIQADGRGEAKKLASGEGEYLFNPFWAPDSKKLLFSNQAGALYLHDLKTNETKLIDQDPWSAQPHASWSHDSSWIAYTKSQDNTLWSIHLYSVADGQSHQVTSGRFFDTWPTFDRKGEYLYFASQRDFTSPTYDDMGQTFIYNNTDQLFVVPLRKDVKSPFLAESDEQTWTEEKEEEEASEDDSEDSEEEEKSEESSEEESSDEDAEDESEESDDDAEDESEEISEDNAAEDSSEADSETAADDESSDSEDASDADASDEKKAEDASNDAEKSGDEKAESKNQDGEATKAEPKSLKIDLEDFERRVIHLPVPSGGFTNLVVSESGKLYYLRSGESIKFYDISSPDSGEQSMLDRGGPFTMSAEGKALLVARDRGFFIVERPNAAERVPTAGMRKVIEDPREEWRQIFWDAWRIYRVYFYDPNMHGVDWKAIGDRYAAQIDDAMSRADVNFILGELIAELNVGHAYVSAPGDIETGPTVPVGLLGADFALENGAYRIARIVEGAPWDVDARSPLGEPGVDAKVGDYVLAVNGVPVDVSKDPWASFLGLAGQVVELTLSDKPEIDESARHVLVQPLYGESDLRYRAWVEANRQYVHDKSGGKIGYVYVPDTGANGQNELFRQFYAEMEKPALIIDERWNGGGQIPWRFIELLDRPTFQYIPWRYGGDARVPRVSHQGPKAMLINGAAGSGGDEFPWLFRLKGLGKLIGTRTWGGLVGLSGNPGLIDGGFVSAPAMAFFEPDGTWSVEGHGVDPDIEVLDDPTARAQGRDPQMDKAIEVLLEELEKNPPQPVKRPAYPDRSGMGVAKEDW
jgi:tricorn protease